MSDEYRPDLLMKKMKAKVMALLKEEARLSAKERQSQQWQLLLQIENVGQFIVGKGGINTMFYIVNNGERKLCLPADMVNKIDKWIVKLSVKSYSIYLDGKKIKSGLSTIEEAKKVKAKRGSIIYEIEAGKKKKVLVCKKALMGNAWSAVK